MSYPESSYDGADGSREQDMDEADHQLKELNHQLGELEDELQEALETNGDPAWVVPIEEEIFEVRGKITDIKRFLGITEF
jgi:hypothetical protein